MVLEINQPTLRELKHISLLGSFPVWDLQILASDYRISKLITHDPIDHKPFVCSFLFFFFFKTGDILPPGTFLKLKLSLLLSLTVAANVSLIYTLLMYLIISNNIYIQMQNNRYST